LQRPGRGIDSVLCLFQGPQELRWSFRFAY